jgi:hypothetical protein
MAYQAGSSDRGGDDPERAFLATVRLALVPTVSLPLTLAFLLASLCGQGPPVGLLWPLAALVLTLNVACWLKVIELWRTLPGPDDDDQDWRRGWDRDSPRDPERGPGGIRFDWAGFERDFWAHVKSAERQRERELIHASASVALMAYVTTKSHGG